MLMAEDVLLLLVDDRTGRFLVDSTRLDNVLAGAVLVELVTIERVGFPPAGRGVKRGRMVVVDPTPPGDPVLHGAVGEVELEVELPGHGVAARASSTDVVQAAGLALVAALNQYNAKRQSQG